MPGETAAGSAGEQPDQGIARLGSSRRCPAGWGEQLTPHPHLHHIGSIDPLCLKKLPPEGRNYSLTKSGYSPLSAEPRHMPIDENHYLQWMRWSDMEAMTSGPPIRGGNSKPDANDYSLSKREKTGETDWALNVRGCSSLSARQLDDGTVLLSGVFSESLALDDVVTLRATRPEYKLDPEFSSLFFVRWSPTDGIIWSKSIGPTNFGSEGSFASSTDSNGDTYVVTNYRPPLTIPGIGTFGGHLSFGQPEILVASITKNGMITYAARLGKGWTFIEFVASFGTTSISFVGTANGRVSFNQADGGQYGFNNEGYCATVGLSSN